MTLVTQRGTASDEWQVGGERCHFGGEASFVCGENLAFQAPQKEASGRLLLTFRWSRPQCTSLSPSPCPVCLSP